MKNYSKLGLFKSKGRLYYEPQNHYRTPFQRDRDRIIHSASFRRLKHKTQVFVNTEGDHYRTRITHSLEVSQVARSIAKYLNLNDDLAETLSLAHDLGHTPFGHAGEDALNECMESFGGFDHNLQTLRIVMFLEHKYLKFKGLNLTIETLDGLLKHNGPILNLSKIKDLIGLKNLQNKIVFNKSASLEAQISSISDDIAYNNHDIQDGIKAKLFKLNDAGEEIWSFQGDNGSWSVPAISQKGSVYYGTSSRTFYCIDYDNGKEKWKLNFSNADCGEDCLCN